MHFGTMHIRAAIAVATAGTAGGMTLAAFTTGGMWPSSTVALAGVSPKDSGSYQVPAPVVADPPPERYVCTGCFPTLAERQQQYYERVSLGDAAYDEAAQLASLPPYEPAPLDEGTDEHADLPAQADDPPSDPAATTARIAYW